MVYTVRRELSEVLMSSTPRKVLAPSDFMSRSGLVKDNLKGYRSFPESGNTKSALDFLNEYIAEDHVQWWLQRSNLLTGLPLDFQNPH